jgi:hypothetical protein
LRPSWLWQFVLREVSSGGVVHGVWWLVLVAVCGFSSWRLVRLWPFPVEPVVVQPKFAFC